MAPRTASHWLCIQRSGPCLPLMASILQLLLIASWPAASSHFFAS
uniref:Uncharacterized protein n=1 Tax=Arundo donax TaxID=35708 RepID=A0A0A9HSN1_ARUDO